MMGYSLWRRLLLISCILTIFVSYASASGPYFPNIQDKIEGIFKRQGTSIATGGTAVTTPATTPTPTTPTTTPTPTPTTPTTTPTPTTPTTTTTPNTPTTPTTPATTPPTTSQKPTDTKQSTVTAPLVASTTVVSTSIIIFTDSSGQLATSMSVTSQVSSFTTGSVTSIVTPGVISGSSSSNNKSSGLSSSSKSIIGGVVGGVGGAILLAGLAFAFFRIRRRKRYDPNEDMDYTAGTGQGLGSSGADKQNLASDEAHNDRYTGNPRPNAAANF